MRDVSPLVICTFAVWVEKNNSNDIIFVNRIKIINDNIKCDENYSRISKDILLEISDIVNEIVNNTIVDQSQSNNQYNGNDTLNNPIYNIVNQLQSTIDIDYEEIRSLQVIKSITRNNLKDEFKYLSLKKKKKCRIK
jgi:hypothetical protein